MNRLGVFLKKIRIEHNEVLFDMAKRLKVSTAFLSAVENGRKAAPLSWIESIAQEYKLDVAQKEELVDVISESIKQVRMDTEHAPMNRRKCVLAFARKFDDISDEDIQDIMSILERGDASERKET